MQLDSFIDVEPSAAAALTRDLPRDQALGLRLLAMARAAAGIHMAGAAGIALGERSAQVAFAAQEPARDGRGAGPQIVRSQAGRLVEMVRRQEEHGQDARATEGGAIQ